MKKLTLLLLLISWVAISQEKISTNHFLLEKGVALSGFDPVSYFSNKPQKGKIAYNYEGIIYNFVSAENLTLFKISPQKYLPAYGGWCAYAMGLNGEKVKVDPENFKIIDGKNHLFYRTAFANTLNDWNKNEAKLKRQADINWSKILK